jgi:hypothetical protein
MKQRDDILHKDGPFQGLSTGDLVYVIYDGAPTALIRLTRVKQHALEGTEGEYKCRITMVTPRDLRFYAELGPNRETVLRPITLRRAGEVI